MAGGRIRGRPEKGCQVSVSVIRLPRKSHEAREAMPFLERVIVVVHFKVISLKKYRRHTNTLMLGGYDCFSVIPVTAVTKLLCLVPYFF